jgi:cobyrinic acid a,c-diamide synthase
VRGSGLILAAPASGSGKTVVTLGLLRELRRRGRTVAAAKAGPDYIDATFHRAASGGACVNLDCWAMRRASLAALVDRLAASAELVLCEGVMGLFDGTGEGGEEGSTAALACLTGWPVVLIVDVRGQGASAAALARGFAGHDPGVALAGIILNRVAGPRHRAIVEGALARHLPGLPCLGALPAAAELALPSRHLGLVPANELTLASSVVAAAAAAVAAGIDLDRLTALARPAILSGAAAAPAMRNAGIPPLGIAPLGQRIAVAEDDAFLFTYPALLAEWRAQGAEIAPFSPLADETPDPDADAIYLPGGYPELHAARLAAAGACLGGLRRAAAAGLPIYGECGGYMLLGDTLTDRAGAVHAMAGLLPVATSFAERHRHLGYRRLSLVADGPLGPAGAAFRGHEFHYASLTREERAAPLFHASDAAAGDLGACGTRRGSVCGSFVHLIDRWR